VTAPVNPRVELPTAKPPADKPPVERPPAQKPTIEEPPAEKPTIEPPPAAEVTRPTMPRTPRTVRVAIVSDPPGADVCLAKDRILIGHTKLDWKIEKSSGTAKLLIRKRGYRGEDFTLKLEHDTNKAIKLDKLGPDDIDDIDTCEKR